MTDLVIDASVAAKWYLPEKDSALADRIFERHATLHAPDLLRLEFANVFQRHAVGGAVDPDTWFVAREELQSAIGCWHDDADLLQDAYRIASSLRQPIYDCVYLALANRLGGVCLTGDRRLLKILAGTPFAHLAADFAVETE